MKWGLSLFALFLLIFEISYFIFAQKFAEEQIRPLVNGHPEKLKLDYSRVETSWIPGLVKVDDFTIGGQDGSTLWKVEVKKIHALISLPHLLFRRLSVAFVQGEGGRVLITPGVPKLPSKPQTPSSTPSNTKPRAPFRLAFHNIHIKDFEEISVLPYVFRGPTQIRGMFSLWPGRELDIDGGRVDFSQGELTRGDLPMLSNPQGYVQANIDDYRPGQDNLEQLFDKISAQIHLRGLLTKVDLINPYLKSVPWLKVKEMTGEFQSDVFVQEGSLAAPSAMTVGMSQMQAQLGAYTGNGKGEISWKTERRTAQKNITPSKDDLEDVLNLKLNLSEYSFLDREGKVKFVEGRDFGLAAATRDLKIVKIFSEVKDFQVGLIFPQAQVNDLRVINDFFPSTERFGIRRGSATLDAQIYLSTKTSAQPGYLRIVSKNSQMHFDQMRLKAKWSFSSTVHDQGEGIDDFTLSDTRLSVANLELHDPQAYPRRDIRGWKGSVNFDDTHLRPYNRMKASGTMTYEFDNLEPLLVMLGSEYKVVRFIKKVTAMKRVHGSSQFNLGVRLIDLSEVKFHSSDVNIEGRLRLLDDSKNLLAWFRYGGLQLALDVRDKKSSFAFKKAQEWFEKRSQWPELEDTRTDP